MEEGIEWDDFEEPCLLDNWYTSVLATIMGKLEKVSEEGNEWIS